MLLRAHGNDSPSQSVTKPPLPTGSDSARKQLLLTRKLREPASDSVSTRRNVGKLNSNASGAAGNRSNVQLPERPTGRLRMLA